MLEDNATQVDPDLVPSSGLLASLEGEKTTEVNQPTEPKNEIPEKFRGKSAEEIIKSYQELESQLGKQGSELGELRKLTDQYILSQQPLAKPTEEHADWSSQPDIAVKNLVEQELAPLKNDILEARQMKMDAKLRQAHGDYMDVVQSSEFHKWVTESPIRIELFARADRNYDAASGVELISMFKASRPQPRNTSEEAAARDTALANSAMETSGVTEGSPKKVYRRADLINLRINNPDRYNALSDEIMRAYAEGRVR